MASRGTEGLRDVQGRCPAPGTDKTMWTTGRAGRIDRIWANRGHMEWAARGGLDEEGGGGLHEEGELSNLRKGAANAARLHRCFIYRTTQIQPGAGEFAAESPQSCVPRRL